MNSATSGIPPDLRFRTFSSRSRLMRYSSNKILERDGSFGLSPENPKPNSPTLPAKPNSPASPPRCGNFRAEPATTRVSILRRQFSSSSPCPSSPTPRPRPQKHPELLLYLHLFLLFRLVLREILEREMETMAMAMAMAMVMVMVMVMPTTRMVGIPLSGFYWLSCGRLHVRACVVPGPFAVTGILTEPLVRS